MTEVRLLEPVRAIPLDKATFHARKQPGSFFVGEPTDEAEFLFWYRCPCGCNAVSALLVGENFKPEDSPSWEWNGSLAAATLMPSVWHRGHWHGWLRNGRWVQS